MENLKILSDIELDKLRKDWAWLVTTNAALCVEDEYENYEECMPKNEDGEIIHEAGHENFDDGDVHAYCCIRAIHYRLTGEDIDDECIGIDDKDED